jgi:tetratricopeptide (TPR) repeat protein
LESLGNITSSNKYINLHSQALIEWSLGQFSKAADTWEQILVLYPFDMMAIKFVSDTYFYIGNRDMLRDSIARILPIWETSSDRPLKSYLYGMYAFGLGETNMIERAEKEARFGLDLNPHDGWATHALAHSLEYAGEISQGINFLKKTNQEWEKCDIIKPHIDWHWALYEIEHGNRDAAEDILTNHILNQDTELCMLDFVDIASLIYRLKLSGQKSSTIYSSTQLKNFLNDHLHDHILIFNDLHMYFILDDYTDPENRNHFLRTLKESYDILDSDNSQVYRQVGQYIFQAIDQFKENNYSEVVKLLYPIRNKIYKIGGSNAQRDLFYLLLIHSAVYSNNQQHQKLGRQLISERCLMRNKTKSKMMENYANSILND